MTTTMDLLASIAETAQEARNATDDGDVARTTLFSIIGLDDLGAMWGCMTTDPELAAMFRSEAMAKAAAFKNACRMAKRSLTASAILAQEILYIGDTAGGCMRSRNMDNWVPHLNEETEMVDMVTLKLCIQASHEYIYGFSG